MINVCLELWNIFKVYGFDGESVFIKVLDLEFFFVFGFLCLLYIVRNIEYKIKFDLYFFDSFYRIVVIDFLLINSKRDWLIVIVVLILI